jgi:hypothetical protein
MEVITVIAAMMRVTMLQVTDWFLEWIWIPDRFGEFRLPLVFAFPKQALKV